MDEPECSSVAQRQVTQDPDVAVEVCTPYHECVRSELSVSLPRPDARTDDVYHDELHSPCFVAPEEHGIRKTHGFAPAPVGIAADA